MVMILVSTTHPGTTQGSTNTYGVSNAPSFCILISSSKVPRVKAEGTMEKKDHLGARNYPEPFGLKHCLRTWHPGASCHLETPDSWAMGQKEPQQAQMFQKQPEVTKISARS